MPTIHLSDGRFPSKILSRPKLVQKLKVLLRPRPVSGILVVSLRYAACVVVLRPRRRAASKKSEKHSRGELTFFFRQPQIDRYSPRRMSGHLRVTSQECPISGLKRTPGELCIAFIGHYSGRCKHLLLFGHRRMFSLPHVFAVLVTHIQFRKPPLPPVLSHCLGSQTSCYSFNPAPPTRK